MYNKEIKMIEKEGFLNFVNSELIKNNVSTDVLQNNYSIFLYEKYLKLLGVDVHEVVNCILDPMFIDLDEYELELIKTALWNAARENNVLDNTVYDNSFKSAFSAFMRANQDKRLKYKEYEQLCSDINYLTACLIENKDLKTVQTSLWDSSCKQLQVVLKLDGFPYSNKNLFFNQKQNHIGFQYYKLLYELHDLATALYIPPAKALVCINLLIVQILLQSPIVKSDDECVILLKEWEIRVQKIVDVHLYKDLSEAFYKDKLNIFNTFLLDKDEEKIKELKKVIKNWLTKKET